MNFFAEMMEKLGDEVDVIRRHLKTKKWKVGKIIFLNSIFIPFLKLEIFLKPYLESSFHVDFENGIKMEFSCRNNEEIWCWSGHKKSDK